MLWFNPDHSLGLKCLPKESKRMKNARDLWQSDHNLFLFTWLNLHQRSVRLKCYIRISILFVFLRRISDILFVSSSVFVYYLYLSICSSWRFAEAHACSVLKRWKIGPARDFEPQERIGIQQLQQRCPFKGRPTIGAPNGWPIKNGTMIAIEEAYMRGRPLIKLTYDTYGRSIYWLKPGQSEESAQPLLDG